MWCLGAKKDIWLYSKGPILAIDWGSVYLGIAISDPDRVLARNLGVIKAQEIDRLNVIFPEFNQIFGIILGNPLDISGHETKTSILIKNFGNRLWQKFKKPLALWDESLTSSVAGEILKPFSLSRRKKRKIINGLAATILLQSALDFLNSQEK